MNHHSVEWDAASAFGGDLGVAYLGTQGDPRDAQKHMAPATVGATAAMLITAVINWQYSARPRTPLGRQPAGQAPDPLGEDELARRIREQGLPQRVSTKRRVRWAAVRSDSFR